MPECDGPVCPLQYSLSCERTVPPICRVHEGTDTRNASTIPALHATPTGGPGVGGMNRPVSHPHKRGWPGELSSSPVTGHESPITRPPRVCRAAGPCENDSMTKLIKKPSITAVTLLAAGFLLLGNLEAQQPPAANPPAPAPAAKSQAAPGAKASQTPATKATTGQGTALKKPAVLSLKTPKEKASYAIGVNIGKGLHRDSVDVDPAILSRGLRDGLGGGK